MILNNKEKQLIKKYGHLFGNTGGNDIQELLERQGVNIQNNAIVTLMKVSCEGQLAMLLRLENEGLIKDKDKDKDKEPKAEIKRQPLVRVCSTCRSSSTNNKLGTLCGRHCQQYDKWSPVILEASKGRKVRKECK